MNGIQGLMQAPGQSQGQAPQAPGQAMPPGQGQPPMPGMQPRMGGAQAGVQSLTPALTQMNKQQLLMEMMNPNSQIPKFALLSAIDQKVKQEKAMQAVQGSMAQQQAQQQQQQGSVAQGVIQEAMQGAPVMARHGGAMHSYADGGAVAFQFGGGAFSPDARSRWEAAMSVEPTPEPIIYTPTSSLPTESQASQSLQRLQEEARAIEAQLAKYGLVQRQRDPQGFAELQRRKEAVNENLDLARRAQDAAQWRTQQSIPAPSETEVPAAQAGPVSPAAAQMMRTPVAPAGPALTTEVPERLKDTRGIPALVAPPAAPVERPPAKRPPVERPPVTPPSAQQAPAAETDQALQNRLSELRSRRDLPEDILFGRAGIESLVREEMKARQDRLAQDRAAAEERRRETIERAPGLGSPEGLLAIASSIDPRRGQIMGSLAKGAYGVMAGQRKAQEEARKEFREFERAERTEQNLLSQMRTLEAQRLQAIREKDVERANTITDQLYSTQREYEKTVREGKEKQEDLAIKRLAAEAAKSEGQAKATTATAQLESLNLSRKQNAISNAQLRLVNLIDKRKEVPAGILGPMAAMFNMDEKKFAETYPDKYKEVKTALSAYDNDIKSARNRLDELLAAADGLPAGVKVTPRTGK